MSDRGVARLDAELVRRGLARSRGRAAVMVAEGRVRVQGEVARKASRPVLESDEVEVQPPAGREYVSRAADKLIGALDAITDLTGEVVPVHGARCLDAGASTGGFTEVLLERGAVEVVAVDVGHGQMATSVADDPRVVVREGTNVRDLTPVDLDPLPTVVVADLSFISLALVAGTLVRLTAPGGHLVLMVKPQFEVGRERLAATGVVTSQALREESVLRVAGAVHAAGAEVRAVVPSPLPGPAGNREYFLWAAAPTNPQQHGGGPDPGLTGRLRIAVRRAVVDAAPAMVGAARTEADGATAAGPRRNT